MPYITTGQLGSYLGITTPSAADTVQLAGFIASAQAIIERRTGRTFEATADTTRYFDAYRDVDYDMLWLNGDLCQITTVTNGNGVALTAAQYVTEPRFHTPYYALRLRSDAGITWTYSTQHENSIAIVGRWAYSLSAPADVQQVTLRLASWLYRQKDSGAEIDRPLLAGDGSVILPATLPGDALAMLRPYVRAI
jgi:hypothetical protein